VKVNRVICSKKKVLWQCQ